MSFFFLFQFFVGLCLISLGVANGQGANSSSPKCTQVYEVYETIFKDQCSTTHEKKCETNYSTEYVTKYNTVCDTVYVKQCQQIYKDVPDKLCSTSYEQVCVPEHKTTYSTIYKGNCVTVPKQVMASSFFIVQLGSEIRPFHFWTF